MRKRLVAIGNSYGIVLDRALLALLGARPDSELDLQIEGKRLVVEVAPEDPADHREPRRSRRGGA